VKCAKAEKLLALHAGGDLPDADIEKLDRHLDQCHKCREKLDAYRVARSITGKLADVDQPEELPDDFAERVYGMAEEGTETVTSSHRFFGLNWRSLAACGAAAAILVSVIALSSHLNRQKGLIVNEWESELKQATQPKPSTIDWNEVPQLSDLFIGPIRAEDWEPLSLAGVIAVMHKADPEGEPDKFTIDYCGESGNIGSYRNYPWFEHRKRRLISRTGSIENIYVAVLPMPQSTERERRKIKSVLIATFDPYFNRRKGA